MTKIPSYTAGYKDGYIKGISKRDDITQCCCSFDEFDDILQLCMAHKEWFEKGMKRSKYCFKDKQ